MGKRYGEVGISKRKSGTHWTWAARLREYDDDNNTRKQLMRILPVECDAPTPSEKGRRSTPTGRGARQALRLAREWRESLVADAAAEAAEVEASGPGMALVPELVRRYWSTRTVVDETMRGYEGLYKHIDVDELRVPARELTPEHVQTWIAGRLDAGVSENTMNKSFNQVKYALRWAVGMGWVDRNPADAIKPPRRSHRGPNPLDASAAERVVGMLDALREHGTETQRLLADAAELALHTGMRIGELCGLRFSDIDGLVEGGYGICGTLHVRRVVEAHRGGRRLREWTKNGEQRSIPVSAECAAVLCRIKKEIVKEVGEKGAGRCFVLSRRGARGEFLSTAYLSKEWTSFASVNGVCGVSGERCHFHDLRHTWATLALAGGADIAAISRVLGHKDSATTLRYYARWMPESTETAVVNVSATVSPGVSNKDFDFGLMFND